MRKLFSLTLVLFVAGCYNAPPPPPPQQPTGRIEIQIERPVHPRPPVIVVPPSHPEGHLDIRIDRDHRRRGVDVDVNIQKTTENTQPEKK